MSADGTTAGAPLKRGYAFSQYAKYVRPGYQRVALTKSAKASPLEVTAYQGGGKVTLVILNRSNSALMGEAKRSRRCWRSMSSSV